MPQVTFSDPEAASAIELRSERPEINLLPELLQEGEHIDFVGSGSVAGKFAARGWLVVLTNRRLICVAGTNSVNRRLVDVSLSSVRSVHWRKGPLRATVTLKTELGTVRVSNMRKTAAAELFAAISKPLAIRDRARFGNPLNWGNPRPTSSEESSPPAFAPAPLVHATPAAHLMPPAALETRVHHLEALTESLESEVAQLREQVAFLEELLQAKATN